MRRARLLIADDQALAVAGLKKLLEHKFEVIGTVQGGCALMKAARELQPHLVLLAVSAPLRNGIDVVRRLTKLLPKLKILFVNMQTDADCVTEALQAEAAGYVLMRSAPSELTTAIREVLGGRTYVTPLAGRPLAKNGTLENGLTPRQREVLLLVAEGQSTKQVAASLNVSVKTIEFHRSCIMQKLGVRNLAQLVTYVIGRESIRR